MLCISYMHNILEPSRNFCVSFIRNAISQITKITSNLKILSFAVPESCFTVSNCSCITTDGEYWIYPTVTNRRFYSFKIPQHLCLSSQLILDNTKSTVLIGYLRFVEKTEFLKMKLQIEVKLVYCMLCFMYNTAGIIFVNGMFVMFLKYFKNAICLLTEHGGKWN